MLDMEDIVDMAGMEVIKIHGEECHNINIGDNSNNNIMYLNMLLNKYIMQHQFIINNVFHKYIKLKLLKVKFVHLICNKSKLIFLQLKMQYAQLLDNTQKQLVSLAVIMVLLVVLQLLITVIYKQTHNLNYKHPHNNYIINNYKIPYKKLLEKVNY